MFPSGGDPATPSGAALPGRADPAALRDERTGLAVVWCGVAALMTSVALLVAETAAIPFQVGESVAAADSFGNFWPLLGVLALGALGAALVIGGRRSRRTARRRREWAPSVRR